MSAFYYEPHNWLIHKLMWEHLKGVVPKFGKGILLDLGCGRKPYKELFSPFISTYIGLDYQIRDKSYQQPEILADVQSLPIHSGSVDTVLLSEVLEHLPLPFEAIKEIQRILKPGGHLILTTPFFWHLHEKPHDYYRYTKYGLQYILEKSGLKVVHMAELTGFIATFAQLGSYWVWWHPLSRWVRWLIYPFIWLLQRTVYWLNKLDKSNEFNCLNIAVGKKEY